MSSSQSSQWTWSDDHQRYYRCVHSDEANQPIFEWTPEYTDSTENARSSRARGKQPAQPNPEQPFPPPEDTESGPPPHGSSEKERYVRHADIGQQLPTEPNYSQNLPSASEGEGIRNGAGEVTRTKQPRGGAAPPPPYKPASASISSSSSSTQERDVVVPTTTSLRPGSSSSSDWIWSPVYQRYYRMITDDHKGETRYEWAQEAQGSQDSGKTNSAQQLGDLNIARSASFDTIVDPNMAPSGES
ncbi:hypothetical protein BU25DRAFT_122979 [Macroventuria anomochaeta]|uniref:Uncharacterized protein n=1 Tax=Macroventuria anomochaeta TaxID=301207 RepID=A0ACB6RT94_9PLEO|nr:uncharacterized protein BU25DRAFT_122979 [Macroventuria anomochaeta]KAF2625111.1 hypothetical protein BU25DRAFT_122979 [Macroventuria anomochaeta]